jgi:hypothetical protein
MNHGLQGPLIFSIYVTWGCRPTTHWSERYPPEGGVENFTWLRCVLVTGEFVLFWLPQYSPANKTCDPAGRVSPAWLESIWFVARSKLVENVATHVRCRFHSNSRSRG